jgi:hypothetical protein
MRVTSWRVLAASAALALLGGGAALWPRPENLSPEQGIARAIEGAEEAARRGSVEGILEYVADDFKSGMLDKARLRLLLMRASKNSRGVDYDVRFNAPRFLPADPKTPDQRTVISRFAAFEAVGGETLWGTEGVMLVMRKETRRKWLVFSEPVWRVASCPALPPLPGEE